MSTPTLVYHTSFASFYHTYISDHTDPPQSGPSKEPPLFLIWKLVHTTKEEDTFAIDHKHQPSHVMGMDTTTQRARCWLDDLGSQVRNSFDSFVIRAPKIALLSTKTVCNNTIPVAGSSPATTSEPSAPSSCATARDQLTNDNKRLRRRSISLQNLPPITGSYSLAPIAEEEESVKIAVREAILALRLAVNDVDQPQEGESPPESSCQRLSRSDYSRKLRESKLRRHQDACLKAVELAPGSISVVHFKRREGVVFVAQAQRRNSVSSAEKEQRLWRSLSLPRRSSM